jgi:hypothetical protein
VGVRVSPFALQNSEPGTRNRNLKLPFFRSRRIEQLKQRIKAAERENDRLRAIIALDQAHRDRWTELDAALDPTAIEASIARAFASSPVDERPMPHVLLRDVFPAATYAALLDAIPPDSFFPENDPVKQNLKIAQTEIAPAWTRRALQFLEDTVIPGILTPAIVSRMRPYLDAASARLPHIATAGRLMLRRPGYKLEPHLDPQRVAFTCLLYFARPGDDSAYGTQLFSIDRPVTVDRTNTFYPRQHGYKVKRIKTVAFEPNTALVFLNRGGAHAAEIPRKAPPDTRRFAYQFYVAPDPAAMESLVGNHNSQIANHK